MNIYLQTSASIQPRTGCRKIHAYPHPIKISLLQTLRRRTSSSSHGADLRNPEALLQETARPSSDVRAYFSRPGLRTLRKRKLLTSVMMKSHLETHHWLSFMFCLNTTMRQINTSYFGDEIIYSFAQYVY